ncbi:MAG TPA: hypothetical protein VJG83_00265 [archaeon]|nr:hypothetical protein [archaeon]
MRRQQTNQKWVERKKREQQIVEKLLKGEKLGKVEQFILGTNLWKTIKLGERQINIQGNIIYRNRKFNFTPRGKVFENTPQGQVEITDANLIGRIISNQFQRPKSM